jgi:predicted TIM-barrel fold metal-dependent hydrolase
LNKELFDFVSQSNGRLVGISSVDIGRPIYIDPVAPGFPYLTIVAGHIEYLYADEAIVVTTKHPNVFIDTFAYTNRHYPPASIDCI